MNQTIIGNDAKVMRVGSAKNRGKKIKFLPHIFIQNINFYNTILNGLCYLSYDELLTILDVDSSAYRVRNDTTLQIVYH